MTTAIFAGSFDPITNGHLDILSQSVSIFDKVIIAIGYNEHKRGFLPVEDRKKIIEECVKQYSNVEVAVFKGFTVEFAKQNNASVLIRGLRNTVDFEYESELAGVNSSIDKSIKTIFFIPKPENKYISSSAIREILNNNGDISKFVPDCVVNYFN